MSTSKMKLLLVLEAAFFGISSALTTGILFVYLVSIEAGVGGISIVVGTAAVIKLIVQLLVYKYPKLLLMRLRPNFILNYSLDRILLIFIPLSQNPYMIAIIYAVAAATPTTAFVNLTIFGSLSESDIKDVTAKRTAVIGVTSIIGYLLAMVLLVFLPVEIKFFYIYALGVGLGLISTLIIAFMDLSGFERIEIPKSIERPEKLFSTSAFFIAILAGGNFLSMVWVPYLMDHLNGPDYIAVAMNLVITFTSVLASLVCRNWSFRQLRFSVGLDVLSPLLALITPLPLIHPMLSAYSSFTYTGSNFIGSFLFANYKRWLGAIRSSILIVVIMCLANIIVAPVGMLLRGNYFFLFLTVFVAKIIAFIISSLTIPEVAAVPEQTARDYSYLLYNKSITGYRISVEISKDTIHTMLRLIAISFIFLVIYIIYRILILIVYQY